MSTLNRISALSSKSRRLRRGVAAAASAAVEVLEHRTLLSTTVHASADTFVRDHNYSLTNFGASPLLFVKNAANGDNRVSFLKFDLTGISNPNSAVLQLTGALQTSSASAIDTGVYPVSDTSWIEGNGTIADSVGDGFDTSNSPPGEMTWNNQPGAGASPLATATINSSTFSTYTFDVTSYVQQQIASGATSVSFALENLQPTEQLSEFLSKESTSNEGSAPALIVSDSTQTPPTAVVAAPTVTNGGASTETVTVTYTGSTGIDPNTIGAGNITVTPYGGGSALNVESLVSTQQNADGSIVAAYTVDAPGGTWTASDNGPYSINVVAGSVADLNGLGVLPSTGSFRVAVNDTVAPTAAISAPNVTAAGGSTYNFSVTFSDNVAVLASSITLQSVAVSGPGGPLNVTHMSLIPSTNAPQIVATFTATTPNGAWTPADDGQYTVTFHPQQVYDTAGNVAAGSTANFSVAIPVPDTTSPTAAVTTPSVNAPGGTTETVTVTYTDNVAVLASTINASDISVTSPSGTPLQVTGVTTSGSGATIKAVYTVAALGGSWDASDNGVYAVNVTAGSVTDTSGNGVAAASTTFNVSAAVADTVPPTAVISAPDINAGGAATQTITVVYTDNVAINLATLGVGNLSASGPSGPLTVTSYTVSGSGASVTATYVVAAPGAGWDASDNGTYTVAINANQVRDTSGNSAALAFGSFAVNVPLPNPTDTSFNNGNVVTGAFIAEATATQPDGKILVVGHEITSGTTSEGVVERLKADGSLDATFGNAGQVLTPAGNNQWYGVTIQGANHFIVAGTDNGDFSLARYDFNGSIDPTFGSSGVTVTDFGSASDTAYAVTLSPTGQIIAAGSSNNRFAFARFDANGHLDTSFGEGGRQLFDTGAATQALGSVAIQNDGKIVAAGSSGGSVDVVRLTSSGDPDATFNSDGVMTVPGLAADTSSTQLDYTTSVALQGDGKIIVASRTGDGHFGVARLNTDGSVDASFGAGGLAKANFGGADEADAVVIQGNGAIIAVGTTLKNGQPLTAVAAFDSTGQLITTFGEGGMATFETGTSSTARELHIGQLVLRAFGGQTTDGKLIVGTSASGGTQTVSSSLRRILVPGTSQQPAIQESLLGVFGVVNGKKARLVVDLGSGRKAIFTLSNGTATALQSGNDIHLEITDVRGAVLGVQVIGGGTVSISNIEVTGNLKGMHAPAAVVSGTIAVSGSAGALMIGSLTGTLDVTGGLASLTTGDLPGSVSVGGALGRLKAAKVTGKVIVSGPIVSINTGDISGEIYGGAGLARARVGAVSGLIAVATTLGLLTANSLSNATILAGATLPGGVLDLSGSLDTFGAGTIGSLHVSGAIASSFVGAGANPVDGNFGNGNDTAAGTGLIRSIFARGGADSATRFEASTFGVARLPAKVVDLTSDSRFIIL